MKVSTPILVSNAAWIRTFVLLVESMGREEQSVASRLENVWTRTECTNFIASTLVWRLVALHEADRSGGEEGRLVVLAMSRATEEKGGTIGTPRKTSFISTPTGSGPRESRKVRIWE